jgi:hypothetical protein
MNNMEDLILHSPQNIRENLDLMCEIYFNTVGNRVIPYYFDHKLAGPASSPALILGCGIVISPSELFPKIHNKDQIYEIDEDDYGININKIKICGSLLNNCSGLNKNRKLKIKGLIIDLYKMYENSYDPDKHEDICVMCPKPVYKLKENELILFKSASYKISKIQSERKYKSPKKSSRKYYSYKTKHKSIKKSSKKSKSKKS